MPSRRPWRTDVAKMLDINTLAQLIYAQNFSMPAGYVKDSAASPGC